MLWSRFSYFFDFFASPALAAWFAWGAWREAAGWGHLSAVLWFVNGLVGWTLIEYVVHRWLFHHAPVVKPAHMAHHDAPEELIASPPGLVPVALALFCQSVMYGASPVAADAFSAGVEVAYLFYCYVHWATHRVRNPRSAYMMRARRRHLLHHYADKDANYGVTTGVWDRVFATVLAARVSRL
jgi:sterol desaturase/sphingolipid hydroxylase (fatty acid hydroxylase superfamily)